MFVIVRFLDEDGRKNSASLPSISLMNTFVARGLLVSFSFHPKHFNGHSKYETKKKRIVRRLTPSVALAPGVGRIEFVVFGC